MKHASLSVAAAAILLGTLIAACASSDDSPPQPTQEAPATEAAPTGTGNAVKPPPPPPDCTTVKCSADGDCAAACGTSGAIGCCDAAHTCFRSSAKTCPAQPMDDGGMKPAY
jgi:hypothetical protein